MVSTSFYQKSCIYSKRQVAGHEPSDVRVRAEFSRDENGDPSYPGSKGANAAIWLMIVTTRAIFEPDSICFAGWTIRKVCHGGTAGNRTRVRKVVQKPSLTCLSRQPLAVSANSAAGPNL